MYIYQIFNCNYLTNCETGLNVFSMTSLHLLLRLCDKLGNTFVKAKLCAKFEDKLALFKAARANVQFNCNLV